MMLMILLKLLDSLVLDFIVLSWLLTKWKSLQNLLQEMQKVFVGPQMGKKIKYFV